MIAVRDALTEGVPAFAFRFAVLHPLSDDLSILHELAMSFTPLMCFQVLGISHLAEVLVYVPFLGWNALHVSKLSRKASQCTALMSQCLRAMLSKSWISKQQGRHLVKLQTLSRSAQ